MRHRVWVAILIAAACASPPASTGNLDVDAGRDVYARVCSTCHGAQGGGGAGPALGGVVETFPSCADHVRWVSLGSERWREEVSDTYGPTNKEITGAMPSWEASLTELEIRQVAAFERFQFGGGGLEMVAADCGLGA